MYLLLVNPKAGNHRYRRIEKPFINLLNKQGIKYKIILLDDLANTRDLLKQNIKPDTKGIVAVGGNGTVNVVIDAMVGNSDLPLGIIPISLTNRLAKTLGVTSWKTGVMALSHHEVRHLRLGRIGERYFAGSLIVSPKRTVLANIFKRQNLLKNFIGANIKHVHKEENKVACTLGIDNQFTVHCQLNTMTVYFQDEFGKKMKIHLTTLSDRVPQDSIFRANQLNIESSLNMPILCGNEVVASTPTKIQAVGKTLPVLAASTLKPVPKTEEKIKV